MTSTQTIVDTLDRMSAQQRAVNQRVEKLAGTIADLQGAREPGFTQPSFGIRKGENPLSSRPYSLRRLALRRRLQAANDPAYQGIAKMEADLSDRLGAYYRDCAYPQFSGACLIPLGGDLMSDEDVVDDATGEVRKGMDSSLRQEIREVMPLDAEPDTDELVHIFKRVLRKDMSANTATSGGTLVATAAQGELINVLRAASVLDRAGAVQIEMPPQGAVNMPRITDSVTVTATSEAATISESTPTTGQLSLQAKPYVAMTDVPDELLKFASVSVEAWLRVEFMKEIALKVDRDCINGGGGTAIQGLISFSGINSVTATTTGANGDTLSPADLRTLFGNIAAADAPVEDGSYFLALRPVLWAALMNRRADAVSASDAAGQFLLTPSYASGIGGPRVPATVDGHPVYPTTQVPNNRAKGAASNLTLVLAGCASEYVIARSGVIDFAVTNSDASKFAQRLTTMRACLFCDGGPRHEASFGCIDTLLEA